MITFMKFVSQKGNFGQEVVGPKDPSLYTILICYTESLLQVIAQVSCLLLLLW